MVFMLILIATLYLGIIGLMIASHWKIFVKAGKPGWASIVPIYSIVVLVEIIKKPGIWVLYLILPIVNIIFMIRLSLELAKVFGKDDAYGIGLFILPFVFMPMLAFGDAVYMKDEFNIDEFGKPVVNPNFEHQVK
jgi:hypothetical protein